MPAIRTLLVDDEPLALAGLRSVLAEDPQLEIVGTCGDGEAALASVADLQPELVFLDVQMPGLDGVGVARRLLRTGRAPVIVFVTAHDTFAVDAFEVHALDYVLKPYSDARLLQAVSRAKTRLRGPELEAFAARLAAFVEARPDPRHEPRYQHRLLIQEPGRTRIVMVTEIKWVSGAKNYVEIHTARDVHLHRESMDALEASLDPSRFARIHRSTIVGLEHVDELRTRRGKKVVVIGERELAVSPRHASQLLVRLAR